jgi:hypothetical protein
LRQEKIEKGVSLKKDRVELLESIPKPQNGKQQWPQKNDLQGLTDDELENFELDQFQYWDNSKSGSDSKNNIAFRLLGSNGLKSQVNCSKGSWSGSPESYPFHLTTFSVKDVTRIEVYKGT